MRYSQLVPVVVCLLNAFGPPSDETELQEDCAGQGALTAGVRICGFRAERRDVACCSFVGQFASAQIHTASVTCHLRFRSYRPPPANMQPLGCASGQHFTRSGLTLRSE